MKKYKIKVNVEFVECNEAEVDEPTKNKENGFTMVISEKDAISIDNCENAVLRTAHPAIRDALSKHLSDISKKKRLKKPKQSQ